jgi:hypothetical protein
VQTFLENVASKILADQRPFDQLVIVLPSRRAARFLKRELALKRKQPALAPKISSIEDFVGELSGLEKIEPLSLLFEFFEVYKGNTNESPPQSFDRFLNWAPLLLKDFNDIDAHLVAVDQLFDYLKSYHQIKTWAQEGERTPLISNYLDFWEQAPRLYQSLYERLSDKQQAYLGLQFREAVEQLEWYLENTNIYHYFVGFNALNKAESFLIQGIMDANRGTVFWDIDTYFYNDTQHHAGRFIRKYFESWKHLRAQKKPVLSSYYGEEKTINLIQCTKSIAQAKYAATLAAESQKRDHQQSTALVLGDEQLLIPTLSGLPEDFEDYNVTMGYPLSKTPLFSFFNDYIELFQNNNPSGFSYKAFRSLVSTPFMAAFLKETIAHWEEFIRQKEAQNKRYISLNDFKELKGFENLIDKLFGAIKEVDTMITRLIQLSDLFIDFLEDSKTTQNQWYLYYFDRFRSIFIQLQAHQHAHQIFTSLAMLRQFIRELVAGQTIDFSGTPLKGLQIMGVLETRLLDFDTVIITGVNEGILPAGKGSPSFLPFDVKMKFEIPTFLEQDAIYSYHFFRLLQRAKTIHILYNTHSEGIDSGGPSRFVHQLDLLHHPKHQVNRYTLSNPIIHTDKKGITLQKTAAVLNRLEHWAKKGISPSSLSSYLRDPSEFYNRYILGVRAPIQWAEAMDPRQSGTILHEVFEHIYTPYIGKILLIEDYKHLESEFDQSLTQQYAKFHGGNTRRTGRNYLIFEALKHYGHTLLKVEKKKIVAGATIEILSLEKEVQNTLVLPSSGATIALKGHIDRIDRYNDQIRIIDYKSGKIDPASLHLKDWDKLLSQENPAPAFQLLTYAYLYHLAHPKQLISAGIIAFQNSSSYTLPLRCPDQEKKDKNEYNLSNQHFLDFENQLIRLIEEIMNPALPFFKPD